MSSKTNISKNTIAMHAKNLQCRILIIDDDEDDFFITSEYINNIPTQQFIIDWCPRFTDAIEKMKNREYDLYFVDFYLGAKTGLELLKEAISSNCEEPIVLLTGKGNRTVDMEAMQAGAYDYLIKADLNSEKIERCIRYSLDRASSVKALRDNERKFRSFFEKSKDTVFLADEGLFFKDVNNASSELLGYSHFELLNLSLFSLLPNKKERNLLEESLNAVGQVNDIDVEIQTKGNLIKNCVLSASKETDTMGTRYVQGIIHDITNLKKAEKANLQIQKLAVAGRLVRTLAHEVRNPLNNINLSVEQLMQDDKKEDSGVYLDIIFRNSQRIGDLIDELLNSSKPAEIEMKEYSLQSIMDETITSALDRLTLKRIKLELSYPKENLQVLANAEKLRIALLNIIINAIEAMEEEKGKLIINLRNVGPEHVVMITDNGCGISQENLTRLFEPYFTSKRNGMGLGLASTLNILQSHQASVEVQSRVNEGTTFLITFKSTKSGTK